MRVKTELNQKIKFGVGVGVWIGFLRKTEDLAGSWIGFLKTESELEWSWSGTWPELPISVCYPRIFLYLLSSSCRAFKGLLNDIQLSLGECVIDEIRVVRCDGCTHVRRTAELFHQKSDRKRSRL